MPSSAADVRTKSMSASACGRSGPAAADAEDGRRARRAQRELPQPGRARPRERERRVAAADRDGARHRRLRPLRSPTGRPVRACCAGRAADARLRGPRPEAAADAEAVPRARGVRRRARPGRVDRRRAVHARRLRGALRRDPDRPARARRRRHDLEAGDSITTRARPHTASGTSATNPPRCMSSSVRRVTREGDDETQDDSFNGGSARSSSSSRLPPAAPAVAAGPASTAAARASLPRAGAAGARLGRIRERRRSVDVRPYVKKHPKEQAEVHVHDERVGCAREAPCGAQAGSLPAVRRLGEVLRDERTRPALGHQPCSRTSST